MGGGGWGSEKRHNDVSRSKYWYGLICDAPLSLSGFESRYLIHKKQTSSNNTNGKENIKNKLSLLTN